MTSQEIIDLYYPPGTPGRDIYMRHCGQVADMCCGTASRLGLGIDPGLLHDAAMLHDIGIFLTHAPSIGCHGSKPYICHGVLGAQLLRRHAMGETVARVAERHTGAGITASEVKEQCLPLPVADYMPETLLERLVCYCDKFYSKSGAMQRKSLDEAKDSMARISPYTLWRFMQLHKEFGR